MNLLRRAGAVFDRVLDLLAGIAGVLVISMMIVMCYEVILRYFMHRALAWPVEITEYMIFLIAFLGTAWLLRENGHVRVDIVPGLLPPKAEASLNMTTSLLSSIISLILTWYGLETTIEHFRKGIPVIKTLSLPKSYFLAFIVLGCFLMAIESMRQSVGHIIKIKTMSKEGVKGRS